MTGARSSPQAGAPRAAGPPRTPKRPRAEIVESPRIARLRAELAAGDRAAVERFWAHAAAAGTPLVEDGGDGRRTVTFLWRDRHGCGDGTAQVVLIANRLTDPSVWEDSVLHRLAGTDVWHRSYRLPSTWRSTYLLAPADGRAQPGGTRSGPAARWRGLAADGQLDPLNRATFPDRHGDGLTSVATLPDAGGDDWARRRPGVPRGTVAEHRVDSAALGAARRVWSHVPAGAGGGPPPAVLVLLDGDDWIGRLDGPALLDNLVAAGRLAPLVTLLPDAISPPSRVADLTPGAPFLDFVADELLPWAHAALGAPLEPARTFVAGQSLGGLGALALALARPGRLAGVVVQSASLWWAPPGDERGPADVCWAVERCARAALGGLRLHLEVGDHEWVLLDHHRRLRDALARAGADVSYAEFAGGHEALCWRAGLVDALTGVVGPGS